MRTARALRRDPPHIDGTQLAWPGAQGKFALFGEVLWVGVLTCAGGLAIVTLPAAIAASTRHLHRYLLAEESTVRTWGWDFARALRTGWVLGAAATMLALILVLNVLLAHAKVLPGWQAVLAAGLFGLAALAVLLLQSAVRWTPGDGWRAAVRGGFRSLTADAGAVPWVLAAILLAGVITWQLPPLLVPGLGCLVFAVLTVKERRRS